MERWAQCLLAVAMLVTEAQAYSCWPNPCRNGGTCRSHANGYSYSCSCRDEFRGQNCEIPYVCWHNPCRNGGTCRSYANGYSYNCSCRDEFRGQNCEIPTECSEDRPAGMRVNTSGIFSIQFSGIPHGYADCQWLIAADPGHTVLLQVVKFTKTREMGDNCRYESLQFFDGSTINSGLIKKICDSDMNTLYSTRNHVLVQFLSDVYATQAGFELRFQAIQTSSTSTNQNPQCSPERLRGNISKSFIFSPGFPKDYPNNAKCGWLITAPLDHIIRLQILHMDKEKSDNCSYDSLQIYDGPTENSPLLNICYNYTSSIYSSSNEMKIKFSSNSRGTRSRFKLQYEAILNPIQSTTETLEPSPTEEPEDDETSLSKIIGGVAGVLCLLAIVILGLSISKRNRKSSASFAFSAAFCNAEALTCDSALAQNEGPTDYYSLAIATSNSERATAPADFRSSADVTTEAYQNVRKPTVDFRSPPANVTMEAYHNVRTPTVDFRSPPANVTMEAYHNVRTSTVDFRSSPANVTTEAYQNVPAPNQNATDIYSYATTCSSLATTSHVDDYAYSILVDQSRTTPISDKLKSYAHIPLQASGWSADDPPPMYSEVADAYHIPED